MTEPDRLPAIAGALREAARRFGTPLYVTDAATLAEATATLAAAFPAPWIRQYSVKANDVVGIVARIGRLGFGANVVSRGEWAIARRAGIANGRVTLEGVGKSEADLRAAVDDAAGADPPLWVTVESTDEAAALAQLARARRLEPGALDVLFRLNPDVAPETQAGLAVGVGASKFGMDETELGRAVEIVAATPGLTARGIHLHVGSQLAAVDAWRDGVRRALALTALLGGSLERFDTLDVGGGFPVLPLGVPAPSPRRFAREMPELLAAVPRARRPRRLAIEPGRFLVARAGWLVASVLHVRDRHDPLVVIDAGMTELIRPALYGADHPVVALTANGAPLDAAPAERADQARTSVDGPLCEATDHLGTHSLPALRRGDLVAIRDAGAYAASLASAYNGRPRPPQLILEPDGRLVVARRRGSVTALG